MGSHPGTACANTFILEGDIRGLACANTLSLVLEVCRAAMNEPGTEVLKREGQAGDHRMGL